MPTAALADDRSGSASVFYDEKVADRTAADGMESSILDPTQPRYATQIVDGEEMDQWSGWNRWLKNNLLHEREIIRDAVIDALDRLERKYADKIETLTLRVAELSGEVNVLRGFAAENNGRGRALQLPNWRRDRAAA
jgi:hypothetical protein